MIRKVVKYFDVDKNEKKIGSRIYYYEKHTIKRTTIYFLFVPLYVKDETISIKEVRPL